eukprot:3365564-Lingulodinium_polyedra.AAC.1
MGAGVVNAWMPLKLHPNELANAHLPFGVASTLHSTRGQPRPESAQLTWCTRSCYANTPLPFGVP